MTFLARRPLDSNIHILGRETFLTRIEWADGWPRLARELTADPTDLTSDRKGLPKDDTSVRKAEFPMDQLSPEWTYIRTPREKWWIVSGRKGSVSLHLRSERLSETAQPSWLGIRQDRFHARFTTRMTFKPERTNEEAGLTVFRDKDHYFKYTLVSTTEGTHLQLTSRRIGDTEDRMIARVPYRGKKILLRVSASGRWYSFDYGRSGTNMRALQKDVDGGFLGSPAAGRFTGTMMGLYATGNGSGSANSAYFDRIRY